MINVTAKGVFYDFLNWTDSTTILLKFTGMIFLDDRKVKHFWWFKCTIYIYLDNWRKLTAALMAWTYYPNSRSEADDRREQIYT